LLTDSSFIFAKNGCFIANWYLFFGALLSLSLYDRCAPAGIWTRDLRLERPQCLTGLCSCFDAISYYTTGALYKSLKFIWHKIFSCHFININSIKSAPGQNILISKYDNIEHSLLSNPVSLLGDVAVLRQLN